MAEKKLDKTFIQKKQLTDAEIDNEIKSAMQIAFKDKINGLVVSNKLVLTVYNTLKQLFIEDVDNVTISAPTGSGKSIISYLIGFCSNILLDKLYDKLSENNNFNIENGTNVYILTSSLILQKQIENDIRKFEMENIQSLMGSANYKCVNEKAKDNEGNSPSFAKRFCIGMRKMEISSKLECFKKCPYYQQLDETSAAPISVLNYAYWLKAVPNYYFDRKLMTICDEAHLLPDIISNAFMYKVSYADHYRVNSIIDYLFPTNVNEQLKLSFNKLKMTFNVKIDSTTSNVIFDYCQSFLAIMSSIEENMNFSEEEMNFNPAAKKHKNAYNLIFKKYSQILNFLAEINKDNLFIQSSVDSNLTYGYEYVIRDLDETNIIKEQFINRTFKTVFLSATYGNLTSFTNSFKFKNLKTFKLKSDFDFKKSPIYLTNSGWLNYANFENNIDAVLSDAIKIVNHYKNQNGIIHTGTHYIAKYLQNKIQYLPKHEKNRFLFYEDAKEKEKIVYKLKNGVKNGIKNGFVLVGPSLYEGLDLKDDEGRFNIVVKAPYLGLDDYVKQKMKRYPDWYFNNCLQKLEQGIGRTNRHKNDWSHVYLLDNSLKKISLSLDETITDRLQYINLHKNLI